MDDTVDMDAMDAMVGRAGRDSGGGAFPADGGTDGLGRSLSVDSSSQGRVVRHHPAEKTPLRAAQRVGFSPSTAKMGVSARSGQKGASSLPARVEGCLRV